MADGPRTVRGGEIDWVHCCWFPNGMDCATALPHARYNTAMLRNGEPAAAPLRRGMGWWGGETDVAKAP